jgi:hypothetical protein
MLLLTNLPRIPPDSEKKTRAFSIFMNYSFLHESCLEAEVYKFHGFTVNLFINKGFDLLMPLIIRVYRGVLLRGR